MAPVHPETSWQPELRGLDSSTPSLASLAATAVLDASALVAPGAGFADARSFLGLECVSLPDLLDVLSHYVDQQDGTVTQAGLTAALQEVYEAGHRRLAARAETSASAAQRQAAATEHLIELVDHVYALFDGGKGDNEAGGAVDFLQVRGLTVLLCPRLSFIIYSTPAMRPLPSAQLATGLAALVGDRSPASSVQLAATLFHLHDADGDGLLSQREVSRLAAAYFTFQLPVLGRAASSVEELGELAGEQCISNSADAGASGFVTLDDFSTWFARVVVATRPTTKRKPAHGLRGGGSSTARGGTPAAPVHAAALPVQAAAPPAAPVTAGFRPPAPNPRRALTALSITALTSLPAADAGVVSARVQDLQVWGGPDVVLQPMGASLE